MAEATLDFDSLLNTEADSFEAPPTLPAGSYRAMVKEYKKTEKPSKNGNHGMEIYVTLLEGMDDVDEDELKEYTEAVDELGKRKWKYTFWITADSAYRFTDFLRDVCGLDTTGRSLKQVCAELPGVEVLCFVKHEPSQRNADIVYANIGGFAAAA